MTFLRIVGAALIALVSTESYAGLIVGSGIEDRQTGEKIHLTSSDFDANGNPRYVQFLYTGNGESKKPLGGNLYVHGDVGKFIKSWAVAQGMTKDQQRRRFMQVSRAVYTANNTRIGGTEWNVALNIGGAWLGLKAWEPILQPKTTAQGLIWYVLGVASAPVMLDLVMMPYELIADALDPELHFPFADDLEPLDDTRLENWEIRTQKFGHKAFQSLLRKLEKLPSENPFVRKVLAPDSTPKTCLVKLGTLFIDLMIPMKNDFNLYSTKSGTTKTTRAVKTANELTFGLGGNVAQDQQYYLNTEVSYQVDALLREESKKRALSEGRSATAIYQELKTELRPVTWRLEGGVFQRTVSGQKQICVHTVIDSEYVAQPIIDEECGPLSKQKKVNFRSIINLGRVVGERARTKKPVCEDGLLNFVPYNSALKVRN